MSVEFVYATRLAEYDFGGAHPLRPERFVLTAELADAWGLLAETGVSADGRGEDAASGTSARHALVVAPGTCVEADLLRVHDAAYIAAVRAAGSDPAHWRGGFGIGPGDTPPFPRMHEAAAAVCGATLRAVDDVVAKRCDRAFSPAGGLHHAHRDRAAGFCVYNDLAVAIAKATAERPGLRVAYVDFDAHHGDGVQEAFYARADVLTVSLHESGRYLYPGTGRAIEMGAGAGTGFAVNVPLPPGAGDECYALAFGRVVMPAVRAFAPDVLVAQLGADSHVSDPLAHLQTTVAGQHATARRVVALAEEVCGGRVVATGGGGYDTFSAVPRAWACALAALLGVAPPAAIPESWRALAAEAAGPGAAAPPEATFSEAVLPDAAALGADPRAETERVIEPLVAVHPLLRE